MLEASKVAAGSIYLTLQNLLSTLIGTFGVAFLARAITQEEMGILAALTLIGLTLQLASDLGISQALAKYVSELMGRGEAVSAHIIASLIIRTPLALILCLILFLLSGNISAVLFQGTISQELIGITAIDAFLLSLSPLFINLLLGAGGLKKLAMCGISSVATRWVSIALLIVKGYGTYGVVVGWIIGDLAGLLLYIIFSLDLIKTGKNAFHESTRLIPSLLKFSWPLFSAAIVTFLFQQYDRVLVVAFLPLENVGVYDVSYKAFSVLSGFALALGNSLFPFYGMTYGKKNHEAISSAIKTASRYIIIIIFPLTFGLLATAKPVITLFAGDIYGSGWTVLAILTFFGLTYGVSPALMGLLIIYEKTKHVLLLSFIPVVSSLALLPLLWVLGLNGLAVMRGISLLVTLLLTMYFLSKTVKVEIDKQALVKALIASSIMAATVIVAQQFYYSKFLLPAYILIGAATYLASLKFLKIITEKDVLLLNQTFGKRITAIIVTVLGYRGKE
jgi:O-antigen/teichoic acid export membrane protein